ncbi:ferredoxin [Candidatus Bathyarchaeota archaeon ex4484_205]|nr:MAG: ferredoxin [Candidatus Bathyarchaeota archaeon ex4484_205]RLF90761.1 MAG: ferredoxin [Thermococci archaeon]RLF95167.1 MAG: ferredoxin [Thermococci archaeon]
MKEGLRELPPLPAILDPGNSTRNKTGGWGAFKPNIDKNKCVYCLLCWIYCPDAAISRLEEENKVEVNYEYCKGCGICSQVCPVKAIEMVRR